MSLLKWMAYPGEVIKCYLEQYVAGHDCTRSEGTRRMSDIEFACMMRNPIMYKYQ